MNLSDAMHRPMKKLPDRDWPSTIVLTVLVILTLVLAMLDPSCQYHGPPGERSIRAK